MLIDALLVFNMGEGTLLEWHADYCQMVTDDGEKRVIRDDTDFGAIARLMSTHIPESVMVMFVGSESE
jgi:hypothetical protein